MFSTLVTFLGVLIASLSLTHAAPNQVADLSDLLYRQGNSEGSQEVLGLGDIFSPCNASSPNICKEGLLCFKTEWVLGGAKKLQPLCDSTSSCVCAAGGIVPMGCSGDSANCDQTFRCASLDGNDIEHSNYCVPCDATLSVATFPYNDSAKCKGNSGGVNFSRPFDPCSLLQLGACDIGRENQPSPLQCIEYGQDIWNKPKPCSQTSTECVCLEFNTLRSGIVCENSNICPLGQRCAPSNVFKGTRCHSCLATNATSVFPDQDDENCFSKNSKTPNGIPSPSPSPETQTPACIAVDLLTHLSRNELVFRDHIRAAVLCDAGGSCATPGHMVQYDGVYMMMRSYCAILEGGCRETVKFVNSPHMMSGIRLPSNSAGLKFTALSARYETTVEERALSFLFRVVV